MDTMTLVPTLQEALADTSGLRITPGLFTSHGAVHTLCTADKMHIDSYMATAPWYVQHKRCETHDTPHTCLSCNILPQTCVCGLCIIVSGTACIQAAYVTLCTVLNNSAVQTDVMPLTTCLACICNIQHIHRLPDAISCCSEHWLHKTCRQYSPGACQLITAAASFSHHLA